MRFYVKVSLNIEGTGISCGRYLAARDQAGVPSVAFQYIQSIKRQTGYRSTIIEKVMVDGIQDITKKVKEIENRPIPPMDDIFW
ncbi:hypothetical protein [Neobacillus dielmonensis]|uniref:hypothetical protein n=1 Tax=Neobacillus dielmonensis TaxID=1347369 RepID=UPI0005A9194F|nr:hypothetical protein [Neobacillus dielmonensis]